MLPASAAQKLSKEKVKKLSSMYVSKSENMCKLAEMKLEMEARLNKDETAKKTCTGQDAAEPL